MGNSALSFPEYMKNDSPLNILIVNAHSQANAGDQAIVLGQLQLLKKMFPAARLTVTSRTPRLDRPLLADLGVTVIAPIFSTPSGFPGKWKPWAKTLLSMVFPFQALIFLRHLRRADRVMPCGGGYFYSNRRLPGFTFWQNYLHIRLAVLFKKQVIFFPQSFGPLENQLSRRLIANLLESERVRAVFAREAISLSILQELLPDGAPKSKLQFCPDMAFYYSPALNTFVPPPGFSDLPHPRVALALRDWDFPAQKVRSTQQRKREDYIGGVLEACLELHQKYNASFFIFSQSQGPSLAEDDRRISGYVHERLRASIPPSHLCYFETPIGTTPGTFVHWLRQADMLITSRMHAAIFAFLAGIPAVVIGYQHKSLGILQSLGLGACTLPIDKLRGATLLRLCEEMLLNLGPWRERIARSVPDLRETIAAKFHDLFDKMYL